MKAQLIGESSAGMTAVQIINDNDDLLEASMEGIMNEKQSNPLGVDEELKKENKRRFKVGLPPWKIIDGKQVHDPDHQLTARYRELINKESQ